MSFYVTGGMYENTRFERLTRRDPHSGPFETYEDALENWSERSRATIDIATVRYQIVEADSDEDVARDNTRNHTTPEHAEQ